MEAQISVAFEVGEDGVPVGERIERHDRRTVRRCFPGVAFALGVLIALAVMWRPSPATAADATPAASPVSTTQPSPNANSNGPLAVTVGLYVLEIHELDQQASTYKADFYLWML